MPLIYIIPISLFTLIISYFLFRRVAGSLSPLQPNMISYIFYYDLIIQTFLASILIMLNADGNHYVISTVRSETRIYGWLATQYMMIAMPIGMLISKSLFSRQVSMSYRLKNYISSDVNISYIGKKPLKYSVWIFTLVSSTSCLYVFYVIGYFPLLKIFDISSLMAAELRISVTREFPGNGYIKNIFAQLLMPILSYIWFIYFYKTKNALDGLVFITTFILSLSILYYNFAKAPILMYILSYIFAYFYMNGKINKKILIISLSTTLIILFSMYSYMGVSTSEVLSYNSGPIGRIILSQAGGLYYMLDIFPSSYPHIGLSSISRVLSNLFNIEYVDRAARLAMIDFSPKAVNAGTAGVINSIYIAEAWANFGLIGIIIAPLWVGFLVQTLYIYFLKSPKSPVHLALLISFSYGGSITGGFNDYIYNPIFLITCILFFLIILLAQVLKKLT